MGDCLGWQLGTSEKQKRKACLGDATEGKEQLWIKMGGRQGQGHTRPSGICWRLWVTLRTTGRPGDSVNGAHL